METKDILQKVRKIEIKTRRLSDHIFSGEYHTSFKGKGMSFAEVRQYQYGDDISNRLECYRALQRTLRKGF